MDRQDWTVIAPGASFSALPERSRAAIIQHVSATIGGPVHTLALPQSPDKLPLEILHVPAGLGREWQMLITCGLSATAMSLPDELAEYSRAELLIALPPDLQVPTEADALEQFWPVQLMVQIAEQAVAESGWMMVGQSVATSVQLQMDQSDSSFVTAELRWPRLPAPDAARLWLDADRAVNFYGLTPLHLEEQAYKAQCGASALDDLLAEHGVTELVDLGRAAVAPGFNDSTENQDADYASAMRQHIDTLIGPPDERIALETAAGHEVELLWFGPTAERPMQLGITCGLAEQPLDALADAPDTARRAELMIVLPGAAGGPLDEAPDASWYMLLDLVDLTIAGLRSWSDGAILALEDGEPDWAGALLAKPVGFGPFLAKAPVAQTGETIALHVLRPLYQSELEIARHPQGAARLRKAAGQLGSDVSVPRRPPLV